MKKVLHNLLDEMIEVRHQIHQTPELAKQEKYTALLVSNTLKKYGYDVKENIGGYGVSAILDSGKPGRTVALRAEMDALPIQEETRLAYKSIHDNVMHACGHDGHTATLLMVAAALIPFKDKFKGKIKFIFQPAEETGSGALAMINAGILDNPRVDAIFGYHNTPKCEAGLFKTKIGCFMAGQDTFNIIIKGRGGHAANPNNIIDPIYIGSLLIQAIQSIVSRFNYPLEPLIISITQFHSGTTHNVIADNAFINGTIRTCSVESRQKIKQRLIELTKSIVESFGAKAEVEYQYCFPPTINYKDETELALNVAKEIIGEDNASYLDEQSMASEDFSYYLEKIPGCFFFIGNGVNKGVVHSSKYEFNDKIIPIAAEIMAQVAINYLNKG